MFDMSLVYQKWVHFGLALLVGSALLVGLSSEHFGLALLVGSALLVGLRDVLDLQSRAPIIQHLDRRLHGVVVLS